MEICLNEKPVEPLSSAKWMKMDRTTSQADTVFEGGSVFDLMSRDY